MFLFQEVEVVNAVCLYFNSFNIINKDGELFLTTIISFLLLTKSHLSNCFHRQESDRKLNASEIDFEAWSKTSIDRDIVDREMRIQKKRHFEVPSSMPSEEVLKELEPIKKNTVRFADAPFISNA